jgi:hypothetical protein
MTADRLRRAHKVCSASRSLTGHGSTAQTTPTARGPPRNPDDPLTGKTGRTPGLSKHRRRQRRTRSQGLDFTGPSDGQQHRHADLRAQTPAETHREHPRFGCWRWLLATNPGGHPISTSQHALKQRVWCFLMGLKRTEGGAGGPPQSPGPPSKCRSGPSRHSRTPPPKSPPATPRQRTAPARLIPARTFRTGCPAANRIRG